LDFSFPGIALIAVVFFFAGSVKGLIGVGLPTVAIALLINVMPLSDAIAIIFAPGFASNVWQAAVGGNARAIVLRFWPFLACVIVGTWFGVSVLAVADPAIMAGIFGLVLVIYSAYCLARPAPISFPPSWESWLSPALGTVNGFTSGMTGSYLMPGVLYMQALGLRSEMLIQAMGIYFLCAIIALGASMAGHDLMSLSHAGFSVVMLIPTMIGYVLGERWRRGMREETFRKVFFSGLFALGLYTVVTRFFV
jgi:hypothetical protein